MRYFCWHSWTKWSQQVENYDGVYQYRFCFKCNKVRKIGNSASIFHDLKTWNNPKSEADAKEIEVDSE